MALLADPTYGRSRDGGREAMRCGSASETAAVTGRTSRKEVDAMPETKAQRSAAGRQAAITRKRHAMERKEHERASAVDRTNEMSDDVLKSIESGQRAAIEAVRKFVDTVDEKLPALGERPTRRQEIIDAALEMADQLVHTQYDFIRKVVDSAGKALGTRDGTK
jgi:hypothetical protein